MTSTIWIAASVACLVIYFILTVVVQSDSLKTAVRRRLAKDLQISDKILVQQIPNIKYLELIFTLHARERSVRSYQRGSYMMNKI